MKNHILAGYNAELTTLVFGVVFMGLILAYKIRNESYTWIFEITLGLFVVSLSEFIRRCWWAIWKDGYISRDSVSWMIDHPIVWATSVGVIVGFILMIKGLSRGVHRGRYWITAMACAIAVYFVTLMGR